MPDGKVSSVDAIRRPLKFDLCKDSPGSSRGEEGTRVCGDTSRNRRGLGAKKNKELHKINIEAKRERFVVESSEYKL